MNSNNRRSPLKAGFCRVRSKAEDIFLSVVVRLAEMQKELIKLNWRKSQLEKK